MDTWAPFDLAEVNQFGRMAYQGSLSNHEAFSSYPDNFVVGDCFCRFCRPCGWLAVDSVDFVDSTGDRIEVDFVANVYDALSSATMTYVSQITVIV